MRRKVSVTVSMVNVFYTNKIGTPLRLVTDMSIERRKGRDDSETVNEVCSLDTYVGGFAPNLRDYVEEKRFVQEDATYPENCNKPSEQFFSKLKSI